MANARGIFRGPLNNVQTFALKVWINLEKLKEQTHQTNALKMALISFDPDIYLEAFYPVTEPINPLDYADEEGVPNLEGITLKYVNPPSEDEAKDILTSLLGNKEGILTANDTMRR